MNTTNIDWPGLTHTWNLVTGCKRGCTYCYARRIHERFNKTPFSDIVFHPERLKDKMPKKPTRIFVGSMSDIEYWRVDWANKIIKVCNDNPQHTFMFLSKNPWSYGAFEWPENTMQGLTVPMIDNGYIDDVNEILKYKNSFLSIEPLLGHIYQSATYHFPNLVIVGAMTGPGAVKPKPEWIQSIKDNIPADKIHWKSSMKEYL